MGNTQQQLHSSKITESHNELAQKLDELKSRRNISTNRGIAKQRVQFKSLAHERYSLAQNKKSQHVLGIIGQQNKKNNDRNCEKLSKQNLQRKVEESQQRQKKQKLKIFIRKDKINSYSMPKGNNLNLFKGDRKNSNVITNQKQKNIEKQKQKQKQIDSVKCSGYNVNGMRNNKNRVVKQSILNKRDGVSLSPRYLYKQSLNSKKNNGNAGNNKQKLINKDQREDGINRNLQLPYHDLGQQIKSKKYQNNQIKRLRQLKHLNQNKYKEKASTFNKRHQYYNIQKKSNPMVLDSEEKNNENNMNINNKQRSKSKNNLLMKSKSISPQKNYINIPHQNHKNPLGKHKVLLISTQSNNWNNNVNNTNGYLQTKSNKLLHSTPNYNTKQNSQQNNKPIQNSSLLLLKLTQSTTGLEQLINTPKLKANRRNKQGNNQGFQSPYTINSMEQIKLKQKQYSICSNSQKNISKLHVQQIQSEIKYEKDHPEMQESEDKNIVMDQSIIIRGLDDQQPSSGQKEYKINDRDTSKQISYVNGVKIITFRTGINNQVNEFTTHFNNNNNNVRNINNGLITIKRSHQQLSQHKIYL